MSQMYDKAREAFGKGELDWLTLDARVILINPAAYTLNIATDSVLSDIPSGSRVAVSTRLQNPTDVAGVLDADDITLSTVSGSVGAMVIYAHPGATPGDLIWYINVATNMPFVSSGSDIQILWDNGANKIGKI